MRLLVAIVIQSICIVELYTVELIKSTGCENYFCKNRILSTGYEFQRNIQKNLHFKLRAGLAIILQENALTGLQHLGLLPFC